MSTTVLFVCMGNICRSPTAEGVFKALVNKHKELNVKVDSCGTIGYHAGEPSDPRSVNAAKIRGYDLSQIRARKLTKEDLENFDHVLVMDNENYVNTTGLANGQKNLIDKVKLFMDFSESYTVEEVPDPYYGGSNGFDHVIDLIEDASNGFIKQLVNYHQN